MVWYKSAVGSELPILLVFRKFAQTSIHWSICNFNQKDVHLCSIMYFYLVWSWHIIDNTDFFLCLTPFCHDAGDTKLFPDIIYNPHLVSRKYYSLWNMSSSFFIWWLFYDPCLKYSMNPLSLHGVAKRNLSFEISFRS